MAETITRSKITGAAQARNGGEANEVLKKITLSRKSLRIDNEEDRRKKFKKISDLRTH